jgi:hypothetical protein
MRRGALDTLEAAARGPAATAPNACRFGQLNNEKNIVAEGQCHICFMDHSSKCSDSDTGTAQYELTDTRHRGSEKTCGTGFAGLAGYL